MMAGYRQVLQIEHTPSNNDPYPWHIKQLEQIQQASIPPKKFVYNRGRQCCNDGYYPGMLNPYTQFQEVTFMFGSFFNADSEFKTLDSILEGIFQNHSSVLDHFDKDISSFLTIFRRGKDDKRAEEQYQLAIKDHSLEALNNALALGQKHIMPKVFAKRAEWLFEEGRLVHAARNIEHYLSNCSPDNCQMVKMGIICYYTLAERSFYRPDGPGIKHLMANLQKAKQLLLRLHLFATFDQVWKIALEEVSSRVKLEDIENLKQNLSTKFNPEKKHFNSTNIFSVGSKVALDNYGNLVAAQSIKPNEKLFDETMAAMVSRKDHWTKSCKNCEFCATCNRKVDDWFFPCDQCCQAVFCNYVCQQMGKRTGHNRTCGLSSTDLCYYANSTKMALCYELMASIPISEAIKCSQYPTSSIYHHMIKYPDECPLKLFTFYSLLWTGGIQYIDQIDLTDKRNQRFLYDAIQLSLVLKNQFKLTKRDVNSSGEGLAGVEDMPKLVRVVFAMLVCLDRNPMPKQPLLSQCCPPSERNHHIHGVGLFGSQLLFACPYSANVYARYVYNGKLEYVATEYIEPGDYLALGHYYPRFKHVRKSASVCRCESCNLIEQSSQKKTTAYGNFLGSRFGAAGIEHNLFL